ncbi:MAG: DUF5667 domain-containing protein [Mycobacteriales bacterium]
MNPFGIRGRDEFALMLDGGPVGSFDSYALVAGRLRTAGAALAPVSGPSADFRATLRTRLMAVAAVQAHNPVVVEKPSVAAVSWMQGPRTQRGLGVAAGAMASVVAVAGIAVAGSQSLPGDPFYGVKKGAEAFELRTAGSDVEKGSKHLEFAQERLSEVRGLTLGRDAALGPIAPGSSAAFGGSTSERVRATLAAMDAETRTGSALLTAAYRDSSDEAPLQILAAFASAQGAGLRDLLADAPTAVRARVEDSLLLVTSVGVQTSELLAVGVCTSDCNPTAVAPGLPTGPSGALPQPAPTTGPCGCEPAPTPTPPPAVAPGPESTETPAPDEPSPEPTETTPTPSPSPSPSRTASPSPSPLPIPLPVPVPTLPVPLPTLSPLVPGVLVPVVPAVPSTLAAPLG